MFFLLVIAVPKNYEDFWQILLGHSPSDITALIQKMIEENHPRILIANRVKCCDIFSFLLQVWIIILLNQK